MGLLFKILCLLLIWSDHLHLASIWMIQETCAYIYKIRINVIHACRKYNLHIYMVIIYQILTWNIVFYLPEPSVDLKCGQFHFCSFVYKCLAPTFFFSFKLLVSFSFESFVSVIDNQKQIKCLHRPFSKVFMCICKRLASSLASFFTFCLMHMLTALASASAS